jgi:hypothetical protein
MLRSVDLPNVKLLETVPGIVRTHHCVRLLLQWSYSLVQDNVSVTRRRLGFISDVVFILPLCSFSQFEHVDRLRRLWIMALKCW